MARSRYLRTGAAIAALAVALSGSAGEAREPRSLQGLEERMEEIQDELDAATRRIEELRTREDQLRLNLATTDLEVKRIERRRIALMARVETVARDLYMGANDVTLEAILSSEDLGELASRLEYIAAVGEGNDQILRDHEETENELLAKKDELESNVAELADVDATLSAESDQLQEQFAAASDEYEALKEKFEEEARARAAALLTSSGTDSLPKELQGMVCPVDGPNSFIDSWGFPRSGGRSHEGTDVMAAFDTPVVAITDGTITYAGVGGLSGNWIILTGEDGNEYMYMHNKENLKTSGHVQAGELIATVGDTGNALGGPPHVHFEYHPGGGGPVNPYPLLAALC